MTKFGVCILLICCGLSPCRAGAQNPTPPPGLPPVQAPPNNPITADKAVLGKILFWDEQLSSDNTIACGTCHRSGSGGSDPRTGIHPGSDGVYGNGDDRFASPSVIRQDSNRDYTPDPTFGLEPQVTYRRASSMLMAAFFPDALFWDGSATGQFLDPQTGAVSIPTGGALESQAVVPIMAVDEMAHGNRSWSDIAAKLAASEPLRFASNLPADIVGALQGANSSYPALFQAAYGDPAITAERIAFAIATYERTLVPDQAPIDAIRAGQPANTILTPQQEEGMQVFLNQGECHLCHDGQLGSSRDYANIGLRPWQEDSGRMAVTGSFEDRGRFKTPSLRNVGFRSRFMHNGQFSGMAEVIAFYGRGGDFTDGQYDAIGHISLSAMEQQNLTAFVSFAFDDPRVGAETGVFARPTLQSEMSGGSGSTYGPSRVGSGDFAPEWIALAPPLHGNNAYMVGVKAGLGGAGGFLGISQSAAPSGASIGGVPLNISLFNSPLTTVGLTLSGSGDGNGYATFHAPIPDDPSLAGLTLYGQWWVEDPGATNGFSTSRGLQLTVF